MHWLPRPTPACLSALDANEQAALAKFIRLAGKAGMELWLEPAGGLGRDILRVVKPTKPKRTGTANAVARTAGSRSTRSEVVLHHAIPPKDRLMAMMLILVEGVPTSLRGNELDRLVFCGDALHCLKTGKTLSQADYDVGSDCGPLVPTPPKIWVLRHVLVKRNLLDMTVTETATARTTFYHRSDKVDLAVVGQILDATEHATLRQVLTILPQQENVFVWATHLWNKLGEAGRRKAFRGTPPETLHTK